MMGKLFLLIFTILKGNPLPEAFLRRNPAKSIDEQVCLSEEDKARMRYLDLGTWTKSHPLEKIERLLAGWIPAVKLQLQSPNLRLVGVGYCFGGKYALRLAASSNIDAAAVFHPVSSIGVDVTPIILFEFSSLTQSKSLINIAEDTNGIRVPVLVGAAENDQAVPLEFCRELKTTIEKGPGPVQFEIYEGMRHGFGARPNTADPAVKMQFLKAFNDATAFFDKYVIAS
jgi:dienelactone hydrolase